MQNVKGLTLLTTAQDMKANHPPAPGNPNELVTANAIAKRIQRAPRSVLAALRRLNIQAEASQGKFLLYHPDVIEKVRTSMRKPNRMQPAGKKG